MVFFEWDDDYLIGIESLDYEHRELFQYFNELHEELAHHQDKVAIENYLGEIHARVAVHFALEETLMREHEYPGFAAHKKEHEAFLNNFVEAMKNFMNDPDQKHSDEIEAELKRWIINHVLKTDKKMSQMGAPGGEQRDRPRFLPKFLR